MNPFHHAFAVNDLATTREFYVELLGCSVGRESDTWIDFDFFGHQLSAHVIAGAGGDSPINQVDGKGVPIPHFGVVLEWQAWHHLAGRLRSAGVTFVIEPYVRFAGQPGEQATMFFRDPSGNNLEFKSFQDPSSLFQP